MHPVLRLLRYIPYNLILNRIISGRWGPASGTLSPLPQNVNFMPANFVAPPPILENENCVTSQCPEFYAEDALMLSQVIYLGLLCDFCHTPGALRFTLKACYLVAGRLSGTALASRDPPTSPQPLPRKSCCRGSEAKLLVNHPHWVDLGFIPTAWVRFILPRCFCHAAGGFHPGSQRPAFTLSLLL
ncbi:hypothetical protein DSO57_1037468 [Entomophthora muscae]|uniref:Uncharacterized protein n=1 Tax=Entomophthora muscae TaxID=34485 RepID=A0ACC2SCH7_9FUNG|nr:hypothetical protein DSO57_1037468 [Entomophthora muscae]